MIQAAAVIGIIASFLGLIAAAVTLLFGGAASAFGTSGAGTVVTLGWGGVLFSLAAFVASALIYAKPRGAGMALVCIAVLGAVLGGTLVAICMVLAAIAGILAILGARGRPQPANERATIHSPDIGALPLKRSSTWKWMLAGTTAIIGAVLFAGWLTSSEKGAAATPALRNPVAELESAEASDLKPTGELAAILELGGAHTEVQRENTFRAIQGKVVVWELPVYDVKREDSSYRIATESLATTIFGPSPMVATRITITPRSEAERQDIESLKTGQTIRFKGRINGIAMRRLEISPAILWPARTPDKAVKPVAGNTGTRDIDSLVKHFLSTCKASTTQKAIQLGGMAPDEAEQHATESCTASLPAFQACLTQTQATKDADACATEAHPSAE